MKVRAEWIDFYDAHFLRVVRFVMHNGGSREEARDAAQEAFTESWDLMHKAPGKWQAIERKDAWIRTVALRRYRRPAGLRVRPREASGGTPDLPVPGPGHEELTVQAQMVLAALRVLDPVPRAVMAFDLDDIPPPVIALELDLTQQQVRDMRKKARVVLKQMFAKDRESWGGTA
jgi:DNA-directed RNA polymerase specialized sigma24 family protein